MFWFHGGLGGVEIYGALATSVERPFLGIQARGWMSSHEPLRGIPAMASYYAQIIQAVQPEGAYDLGGYSLGGLLAYEVTRQLQEQGKTVDSIVMLDAMYSEVIKTMTMSRKDMILQLVNALLFASSRPSISDFKSTFIASADVEWERDESVVPEQLIELARRRGLARSAESLRELIAQNVRVQEAYEVLSYDPAPLPRPESVSCFYFRNKSGRFYGDLASVFSAGGSSHELDHINYWEQWQRQMPRFHRQDVDSSNHFTMLSESSSLEAIMQFCRRHYAADLGARRPETVWSGPATEARG